MTHHLIGVRGGDWSDLLQLFDHGPVANIPSVENVIDASEMWLDGPSEQAMGVGNHFNPNGAPLAHGAATGYDPSEACTCFQSKVNGSDDFFGKAASSAFNRLVRAEIHAGHYRHCRRPL